MSGWAAGSAVVPFPVAVGTPLAGYAARVGPAAGTLDELTVGALVLRHDDRRLALLAADVVAVDAALVGEVARAAGLDRAELVVCASHTHSGPAGIVPRLHPAEPDATDPALRRRFVASCAEALTSALAGLESVEIVRGAAPADGVFANRNDPAGPVDPRLTVLATRRSDGSLQAAVVHVACHPTVLGAGNRLVSADFPGALRRALATRLGESPIVLYVNGAAGDVSTRYTRRGQDAAEVERVGDLLADAAVAALDRARPVAGPLRYARLTVPLPPRTFAGLKRPSAAENEAGTNEDAATITATNGLRREAERRRAATRVQGAALLARLAAARSAVVPPSLDLEAWALGDAALIAVAGELFASLGARIVAASPWATTLVLGYANGYAGYLADEAAYDAETYEALASPYAAGAGERVVDAAAALLAGLTRDAARQ